MYCHSTSGIKGVILLWCTCLNGDQRTGYIRHCTLNSYFLVVNFYFVWSNFHIKWARCSWVFPTYIQSCTQILLNLFRAFSAAIFFRSAQKSVHMLNTSLSTVFQVTNNRSTSTIDEIFNFCRTKSLFSINHRMIELPFYWST